MYQANGESFSSFAAAHKISRLEALTLLVWIWYLRRSVSETCLAISECLKLTIRGF
jgi:hypothetical protein